MRTRVFSPTYPTWAQVGGLQGKPAKLYFSFSFEGGAINGVTNKNKEKKIKPPKKQQKKPKPVFPKRWRKGRRKGRKWGRRKWKGRNGRRGRRGHRHRRGKKRRNQKINVKPQKQFNKHLVPLTMTERSETSMSTTSTTEDVKKWEIINGTLVPSAKYMDEMLHS